MYLIAQTEWMRPKPTIKVDHVVFVAEINLPGGEWPLGRITELKPSSDGQGRTAKVNVAGKEMLRPISRLLTTE